MLRESPSSNKLNLNPRAQTAKSENKNMQILKQQTTISRKSSNPNDDKTFATDGFQYVSKPSNNALRDKVTILRQQAAVNMKAALMKVPETWKV